MYPVFKRLVDVLASLACMVLLLPLTLPILILLRFTGDGEIFYFQRRIGLNNRHFHIIKFVTMVKDSLNTGTRSITLRNDPRVTAIGKYLRITKINEFPQLVNVLRGEMSLVGPRPFVDETFQAYPQEIQDRVYRIKPGLTGIGSLVFRDEEGMISRSDDPPHEFYANVISPYKGQLEMWYQQNASMWKDIKIVLCTLLAVCVSSTSWLFWVFPDMPRPFHPALCGWLQVPATIGIHTVADTYAGSEVAQDQQDSREAA